MRKLGWILFCNLFICLEKVVLKLQSNSEASQSAPIFIIGPPRAGTTLLYQILIERYKFTYFSNFTAKFYCAPIVALWIEKYLLRRKFALGGFSSNYGQVSGVFGPSEAGNFWYRWFPKGDYVYVPAYHTSKANLFELRRELLGVSKVGNKPVLFKNTYNSMRIAPLIEAFPEASFLVCRRNPIDTAQSILQARVKFRGSKKKWWALPPKEITEIEQHPYWEQIVEQVYYTYRQIEEDMRQFGTDHFHCVNYEQLCEDTHSILAQIEEFIGTRGIELQVRGEVPLQFPVSSGQKVSDRDYKLIKEAVGALWR